MKKEYDFSGAVRGPVIAPPAGKTRITIRLDDDVLGWFRRQVHASGGGNYQSLINAALREHVGLRNRGFAEAVRGVVREELKRFEARRAVPARRPRREARRKG